MHLFKRGSGKIEGLKQQTGNFRITNAISKPRHVFVFIVNTANIESQTADPFIYNTFSVSTDPRTLNRCYLEVGNGNKYPDLHYKPSKNISLTSVASTLI